MEEVAYAYQREREPHEKPVLAVPQREGAEGGCRQDPEQEASAEHEHTPRDPRRHDDLRERYQGEEAHVPVRRPGEDVEEKAPCLT